VIEEANLTSHVLLSEIRGIATNTEMANSMSAHAAGFSNPEAARIVAEEIVRIGLSHEPATSAPVV
jgi:UDP-N-acetylglucosamine:LPS N-acetylglucosamine transferase